MVDVEIRNENTSSREAVRSSHAVLPKSLSTLFDEKFSF